MVSRRRKKEKTVAPRESAHWRPQKWTPKRCSLFVLHATKHACETLLASVATPEAVKMASELYHRVAEARSVAMLRRLGVKLLGDK